MYSDNLTQKVAQAAAKIMDEELKGKQHKIDANKNGKVDAEDFKLLKAKKEVKEESEQIDELSKDTLRSYLKGSRAENQGSLGSAGHMSDKARSLGRTDDDKDDKEQIKKTILSWCDEAVDIIISTGGTGLMSSVKSVISGS